MNSQTTKNRQVLLASRPSGEPSEENFKLAGTEIPTPGPGQMLLRTIYLSLDPYMRGRMDAGPSYAPHVEIGEVMVGRSVCEVVESNVPEFRPGDMVLAASGWQEYSLANIEGVQKIDRSNGPISYALGVLGMPGLTAYTGLLNIGVFRLSPQKGIVGVRVEATPPAPVRFSGSIPARTLCFAEHRKMQRIFSSASRRETLGKHSKGVRRGGGLKIDSDWAARRVKAGLHVPFTIVSRPKEGEMVATIGELSQSHQFVLIDLEGTASRLLSRAWTKPLPRA